MLPRHLALVAGLTLVLGQPRAEYRMTEQAAQAAPSSYRLINQALAAARIDAETAHKYRVFAAFGDSRLPQPYRGVDTASTEVPPAVFEAGALLPTFSSQTRAELEPFFMPPAQPGSWINLSTVTGKAPGPPRDDTSEDGPSVEVPCPSTSESGRWHTVRAAGGKVKIWAQPRYAGDSAKAEIIAREMNSTIWPRLVTLFWEPLSDANATYDCGGPELDIFLVRPNFSDQNAESNIRRYGRAGPWRGVAMFSDPHKCQQSAAFLLLNSEHALGSATRPGLLQDVAHEFTHAITRRKALKGECADYAWATEATATWAEDWAYPRAQSEHGRAYLFFANTRRPLDEKTDDEDNLRAYAAYVFPLHLMLSGKGRAIPAMWEQFRTNALRAGIEAGLKTQGTNFNEEFPKFAVQNLNRLTAGEYRRIDNLTDSPEVRPDSFQVSVGETVYEKELHMGMPYLSTKYVHFNFDASVKTVTFANTLVPISYAGVWMIEKIKGTWQKPVDFTKTHDKTWCRDVAAEDIEELVLVFTNNEWQYTNRKVDPGRFRPLLKAYATGCNGWIGNTTMISTITATNPNLTIVETVNSAMRFELDSALNIAGQPREYWKVVSGSLSWSVNVSGECTGRASGVLPITDRGPGDEVANLRVWEDGGRMHHSGGVGPWPDDIPQYTITCPTGTATLTFNGALGWWVTDMDRDQVAPNGKTFSGDFTAQGIPGISTRHRYTFRCASGC